MVPFSAMALIKLVITVVVFIVFLQLFG